MLPALAALLSAVSVDATDGEKQDNRSDGIIAIVGRTGKRLIRP